MNRIFSFALWLDAFFKARGHKYIKRVPSGTTKTGKIRYRYIYKVGHTHRGKHVDHYDDMVEGSKFMIHSKAGEEVHLHITGVRRDGMLTIVYDDGAKKGQEETMSKKQLAQLLDKEHGVKQTLESRRKKLEDELKEMKEGGRASEKQIARVQRELDRYGKKKKTRVYTKNEWRTLRNTLTRLFGSGRIQEVETSKLQEYHTDIQGMIEQFAFDKVVHSETYMHENKLAKLIEAREEREREAEERAKRVASLSQMSKNILDKHQVTAEMLDLKNWYTQDRFSLRKTDQAMYSRFRGLQEYASKHSIVKMVDAYNSGLEKACEDQDEVLRLAEEYKQSLNVEVTPEFLNAKQKYYERVEKELKRHPSMVVRRYLKEYGDYTWSQLKKEIKKEELEGLDGAKEVRNRLLQEYGVDIADVAKKESIKDALLNEDNFNDRIVQRLTPIDKHYLSGQLAEKNKSKREALVRAIEKSCSDLIYDPNKDVSPHPALTNKCKPNSPNKENVDRLSAHFFKLFENTGTKINLTVTERKGVRAYINGYLTRVTIDGNGEPPSTIAHEFSHALEKGFMKHVATMAYATRVKPKKYSRLSWSNGKEVAFDDDFISHYTGKIYEGGTSEFISTGAEYFVSSKELVNLALNDPHHFVTMCAILKGHIKQL